MENFEIICKLGKGGFSKVYKVKRKIDNEIYALKKVQILNLSEKQKLSSLNEIRVLASIKNKHIIDYKEAFIDEKDCTLCLITEFADRGDLEKRIKEQKEKGNYFKEEDIWKVFIQIVKGLKALHDMGIMHRDIKSSNIFLFSNGIAKLGDLNVCKILSNDSLGHTQAGTPAYAAPEVWMEKPYGLKSDIWSLGCVLYEMVTLKCPFREDNMVKLYNKVLVGEYKKIPNNFSYEIKWIIEQMINSEINKRFSCDEILNCEYVKKWNEQNNNLIKKSFSEKTINEYKIKKFNLNRNLDNINNHNESNNQLLKTIFMPHNLLYLKGELPKSNYINDINNNDNILKRKSIHLKSKFSSLDDSLKNDSDNKGFLFKLKRDSFQNRCFHKKNKEIYNLLNKNKENNGKIKLKHINSTLISKEMNDLISSENNEFVYENGIKNNNRKSETNLNRKIRDYLIVYEKQKEKEKEKTIQNNKILENKVKEKSYDMKKPNFLSSDKIKLLFNSKRLEKNPGYIKNLPFEKKTKSHEIVPMENNRYNDNENNNNDYNEVYYDINDNKYNNNGRKINLINSYKNICYNSNDNNFNNNINNYKYKKDEYDFTNKHKKKKSIDILPKIKLSYI